MLISFDHYPVYPPMPSSTQQTANSDCQVQNSPKAHPIVFPQCRALRIRAFFWGRFDAGIGPRRERQTHSIRHEQPEGGSGISEGKGLSPTTIILTISR
jgi:hypothetical protein